MYEPAQKNVCFLSRPRRFGKSLLISTLDAYFSGRKDLFKGLRMEELGQAKVKTGHRAVVLIDEYDKPMLDVLGTDMEEKNRNTLKGFYGTFKATDENLRFVLLTGVTKFSQISVFSGFNQPEDISMTERFDSICGIT